jgi:hypothetical protein
MILCPSRDWSRYIAASPALKHSPIIMSEEVAVGWETAQRVTFERDRPANSPYHERNNLNAFAI